MIRIRALLLTITLAVACAAQQGVVVSPRITVEGQPDYTDLGRFVDFFKSKGLAGQDLAIALFQQVANSRTGLYHFNEIFDGAETDYALGNSRDPLKNLNVHNHGFCGIHGPVLEGIFRAAGFDARSFSVPAWSHVATEVFYGGEWHYFDLDLRGALMRPDGVVASAAQARTNASLWDSAHAVAPGFPNVRDKQTGFKMFSARPLDMQYHWGVRGWTTDHMLRPGESLTRWWHNQDGRWHHNPGVYTGWMRALLEKPPRGIKPNNANFSIWGVGSALFVYRPDLTERTRDVELGAYGIHNLRASERGLTTAEAGRGSVVFEVLSPYVIVSVMDDLDQPDSAINRDAATVMIDATSAVEGEVSVDGGRTWAPLGPLPNRARFDLTRWVRGKYGYLVRINLQGQPGAAVLREMEVRTWGQVAPISIPRLAKGRNVLRLGVDDPRGRPTRLLPVLPHLGDPEDIKKYGVHITGDYQPSRASQRLRGQATVPVEAPAGQTIEWLSVGGMFSTHRREQGAQTANKIEVSLSPDGPFRTIYDAAGKVPDWNQHWHYAMDEDVVLPEPARAVWVRYTGNPSVNSIRIYAHCRDPRPVNGGVVRVTHDYSIGDERILKAVEVPAGGSYTIDCPAEPANNALKLEAPHAAR